MKITRRQLRRIIAETINMPMSPAGRMSGIPDATGIDDQRDFLGQAHQSPATMQLDRQFDPEMVGGTNAMHNKTQGMAKAMSPSMARSKSDEIYRQSRMGNASQGPFKAAVTMLRNMLEPEYLLIDPDTDVDLFNQHIQRRQPEPSGRRIMVVMADDSREVVYKDAFPRRASGEEGVNYYHFLIPAGMVGR